LRPGGRAVWQPPRHRTPQGPYEPAKGHRFNHNKVLLDPYAKSIGRGLVWDDAVFGYKMGDPGHDLSFDERDSAPFAPLAVVVDNSFTWGDDRLLRTSWHKTLIYELHVRGYTQLNPKIPEKLRGTYAGLAAEPTIKHLQDLGVTAVEIMPVHHFLNDRHLADKGKTNYWGYNSLNFFAPEPRYVATSLSQDAVQQFKMMVRGLHAAGIEVILDVVYNHTAEGHQTFGAHRARCSPTRAAAVVMLAGMRAIHNHGYSTVDPLKRDGDR
jgi:isoamylase